jgi:alpha-glucosidase
MLAFRRAEPALRSGQGRFLDLEEPVLGFQRGSGDGAILCLFNLSADARTLRVDGVSGLVGPSLDADLDGGRLRLGPYGVAFLRVTGEVKVSI